MSQGRAQKPAGTPDRLADYHDPDRKCRRCGVSLVGLDYRSEFCGKTCRDRWWQQARVRGGTVYQLLVDWRTTRGKKKGILGDLAFIVDGWIAEDKSRG